jgi:N-acetylmuramoyl-L-alanine amidase
MVVIDPGHGGADPGAISINGVYEKAITLQVARALREQLLATGRYRVALTRDGDDFVRLRDRVAQAREQGADLFISLHADSLGQANVSGMSVYTLSDKASDREAEMLAARENRADALGGLDLKAETDEVVSILIDLAQRDTLNQSRRVANLLVEEMGKQVRLLPRPHRSAGFAVLTAPDVPSVLIELGYLSNPKDAKMLTQTEHQVRLARSIARGIDGYFAAATGLSRS